jgi:osmoprotectant transport system permease protein
MLSDLWKYLQIKYNWDLSRPESIPNLFFNHVSIVAWSMFFALLIAFPVSLLIARYDRLYLPVISIAGVLYAIPSVAFLALLVPTVGLNETTVIIALVAYAQIVLIRNFVAAIRGVDSALLDVGRAMGMSETQLLWRVTLPMALPVIIAGLRIATVTSIGIATIAPVVSVPDLGSLIFEGFEPFYPAEILTGALLSTLLAVLADLALLWLQRALSRGRAIAVAQ